MNSLMAIKALKVAYKELTHKYLGHIPVLQRLDRGMDILIRDSQYAYHINNNNSVTITKMEQYGYIKYQVDCREKRCDCPDSAEHGNICKHRLAHELLLKAQGILDRAGL